MKTTVYTITLAGLRPSRVGVEVGPSPDKFDVQGLVGAATREARLRASYALDVVGCDSSGVTAIVQTNDQPISAGCFDLATAVAVLAFKGLLSESSLSGVAFLGELGLDGSLRPVRGVFALLEHAASLGVKRAIVPAASAGEAGHAEGVEVLIAEHLRDVIAFLRGDLPLPSPTPDREPESFDDWPIDRRPIRGAADRVRALVNDGCRRLLLIGLPGSGKTMLARSVPSFLPPMVAERRMVSAIRSVSGLWTGLATNRPFRAPHHTISSAGLVGGGVHVRPGEASLAHAGVLFLDELPEFRQNALQALGSALNEGIGRIARSRSVVEFPASPAIVIAAANPCPCGFRGTTRCRCSSGNVDRYQARLAKSCKTIGVTDCVTLDASRPEDLTDGV